VTEVAISRAVTALPEWLGLALSYVAPGGQVVAMLSKAEDTAIARIATEIGATVKSVRRYELPFSRAPRTVAVFQRGSGG
jgi:16S rRNA G527 N7-methylase RsmG